MTQLADTFTLLFYDKVRHEAGKWAPEVFCFYTSSAVKPFKKASLGKAPVSGLPSLAPSSPKTNMEIPHWASFAKKNVELLL